jgi:hypothetical protein
VLLPWLLLLLKLLRRGGNTSIHLNTETHLKKAGQALTIHRLDLQQHVYDSQTKDISPSSATLPSYAEPCKNSKMINSNPGRASSPRLVRRCRHRWRVARLLLACTGKLHLMHQFHQNGCPGTHCERLTRLAAAYAA